MHLQIKSKNLVHEHTPFSVLKSYFDDVEFIDDVAEMLKWDTAHGQEGVEYDISPEMEYLLIGFTSYEHEHFVIKPKETPKTQYIYLSIPNPFESLSYRISIGKFTAWGNPDTL